MASESSATQSPMRIMNCGFLFEIDYSKLKDLPSGECISSPFAGGGYDWDFVFYPQGTTKYQGSVALYLSLISEAQDITAEFFFKALSRTNNFVNIGSVLVHTFSGYEGGFGHVRCIPRGNLEELYCVNGIITISCNIKVITEHRDVNTYPGGLYEHIEKLREKGDRFDVTFEVEGETFHAHKFMLAARSPVFEAEFFGPTAETKSEYIKIDEMKAKVFKALLHFVYTDQLAIDELSDNGTPSVKLLQDLLVVADRYALFKLTLLCQEQLANNLSVDTVVTTLLLADRHSRSWLKKMCIDFASEPENFLLVALTEDYLHKMPASPALLGELSEKVKSSPVFAKKQRTGMG